MKTLSIDIETYGSTDLIKSGVYKYVEADDFEILLFGFAYDNDPVEIIDLTSEPLPSHILDALTDPDILKTAHNANFERTCIKKFFDYILTDLPVQQWQCTMAHASMLGLPLSLEQCAKVLKLEAQKDKAGKALIKYFSLPCKPTKKNEGRTRNLPCHDPEKWQQFKDYCIQDVNVEREVRNKVSFYSVPPIEKIMWHIDQQINDRGIMIDAGLVKNAIDIDNNHRWKLAEEAIQLTGLENPNSVSQLKEWIEGETDEQINSLNKETVPALLEKVDSKKVKRVLNIRQELSKSSVKKYTSMMAAKCSDDRIRGLHQYYGANRTGRWAGRIVQPHNLPQNHLPDLDLARNLVKGDQYEMLDFLYGNVPDTLSQLIRTAFIAPHGHKFIVCDFSAIEARIIAWLAGEKWRLDVFATHGKIYEASAAHMFKVPIDAVTKGSPLRQKAKIAELALGYGGAVNALLQMGALKMGLKEDELPRLVSQWRNANQKICNYWGSVEDAAMRAVETGIMQTLHPGIRMYMHKGILFIKLPSGRCLSYLRARIAESRHGIECITYDGMNQTTKQWGPQETYGGKLVENLCQAIARDCLADAMVRLHMKGFQIVLHVHDEIVIEDINDGLVSVAEVENIMAQEIPWAKGLPLKAEGFEGTYYKK